MPATVSRVSAQWHAFIIVAISSRTDGEQLFAVELVSQGRAASLPRSKNYPHAINYALSKICRTRPHQTPLHLKHASFHMAAATHGICKKSMTSSCALVTLPAQSTPGPQMPSHASCNCLLQQLVAAIDSELQSNPGSDLQTSSMFKPAGVDRFVLGERIHAVPRKCATTHTSTPAFVSDSLMSNQSSLILPPQSTPHATHVQARTSCTATKTSASCQCMSFLFGFCMTSHTKRLNHRAGQTDSASTIVSLQHIGLHIHVRAGPASNHRTQSTRHASSTNSRTTIGGARDATRKITLVAMLLMSMLTSSLMHHKMTFARFSTLECTRAGTCAPQ